MNNVRGCQKLSSLFGTFAFNKLTHISFSFDYEERKSTILKFNSDSYKVSIKIGISFGFSKG